MPAPDEDDEQPTGLREKAGGFIESFREGDIDGPERAARKERVTPTEAFRQRLAEKGLVEEEPEDAVGQFREKMREKGLVTEKAGWVPYSGPQGGSGWKNTETGDVEYTEEPPGEAVDPGDFVAEEMDLPDDPSPDDIEQAAMAAAEALGADEAKLAEDLADTLGIDDRGELPEGITGDEAAEAIGAALERQTGGADDTGGEDVALESAAEGAEDFDDFVDEYRSQTGDTATDRPQLRDEYEARTGKDAGADGDESDEGSPFSRGEDLPEELEGASDSRMPSIDEMADMNTEQQLAAAEYFGADMDKDDLQKIYDEGGGPEDVAYEIAANADLEGDSREVGTESLADSASFRGVDDITGSEERTLDAAEAMATVMENDGEHAGNVSKDDAYEALQDAGFESGEASDIVTEVFGMSDNVNVMGKPRSSNDPSTDLDGGPGDDGEDAGAGGEGGVSDVRDDFNRDEDEPESAREAAMQTVFEDDPNDETVNEIVDAVESLPEGASEEQVANALRSGPMLDNAEAVAPAFTDFAGGGGDGGDEPAASGRDGDLTPETLQDSAVFRNVGDVTDDPEGVAEAMTSVAAEDGNIERQDAYGALNDAGFAPDEAEEILQEVFALSDNINVVGKPGDSNKAEDPTEKAAGFVERFRSGEI